MPRLADRMQHLGGEQMGRMLARVSRLKAEGKRLIPMHAGEPDFDTPEGITEAAIGALRAGETHYTPTVGLPVLRQAIADHAGSLRGISVDPGQVIVVPGAKPMIYFAMMALCQEGDEVLCPDPAYPFYASLASLNGAIPVSFPLRYSNGFRLDVSELRKLVTSRTRVIVLNSPSNPTGRILTHSDLEAIALVALEHDLYVISDEIYSRIIFDGAFESIASIPGMAERTLIIDGYSKTYAMTGWRLGYGILPFELVDPFSNLMLNTLSCNVAFIQTAAVAALRGTQEPVDRMVEVFCHRRDLIFDGLGRIERLSCLKPEGAFYAFVKFSDIPLTSQALAEHLLDHARVATYPGSAFGRSGEGFLRLSFACSDSDILEGLAKIEHTIAEL